MVGKIRTLVVVFVGLCAAPAAQAQMELGLGPPPTRPFLSPDGSFAGKVPAAWTARDFPRAHTTQFSIPGPGAAWLQVQRHKVAPDTRPKQLVLRSRETTLSKLPHFREFGQQELLVGGLRAASLSGDFWFQGNAEYPRAVEELVVVVGDEAYQMHFECFEPMVGALRAELNQFYMSFVAHPASQPASPGGGSGGGGGGDGDNLQDLMDRVPF